MDDLYIYTSVENDREIIALDGEIVTLITSVCTHVLYRYKRVRGFALNMSTRLICESRCMKIKTRVTHWLCCVMLLPLPTDNDFCRPLPPWIGPQLYT